MWKLSEMAWSRLTTNKIALASVIKNMPTAKNNP